MASPILEIPSKQQTELNEELFAAIKNRSLAEVTDCLDRGAQADAVQERGMQKSALHIAAGIKHPSEESLAILQLLVDHGANLEALDSTKHPPLFDAIRSSSDSFLTLLKAGANPNGHKADVLDFAVDMRFLDETKLLLEYGANPNLPNSYGSAALHVAAKDIFAREFVRLLVSYGADVNACDKEGCTPLHVAAKNEALFCLLLDLGASPSVRNAQGKTPLDVAQDPLKPIFSEMLDSGKRDEIAARVLGDAVSHLNAEETKALQVLWMRVVKLASIWDPKPEVFFGGAKQEDSPWLERLMRNALPYGRADLMPVAAKLRVDAMSDYSYVGDMMKEFTHHVLMPELLAPGYAGRGDPSQQKNWLAALDGGEIESALVPLAAEGLFSSLPPQAIMGLSRAWETTSVPSEIRSLAGNRHWYPLTQDIVVEDKKSASYGWKLHCLTSSEDLAAEDQLRTAAALAEGGLNPTPHCVSESDKRCCEGDLHIYSIRDQDGKYISTLGITGGEGRMLYEKQNKTALNHAVGKAAQQAGEYGLEKMKASWRQGGRPLGETPESRQENNTLPDILQMMECNPTRQQAEKAFRHYKQDRLDAIEWDDSQKKFLPTGTKLIRFEHPYDSGRSVDMGSWLIQTAISKGKSLKNVSPNAQIPKIKVRLRNASSGPVGSGLTQWLASTGLDEKLADLREQMDINAKVPREQESCSL